jgi:hypothetical protein
MVVKEISAIIKKPSTLHQDSRKDSLREVPPEIDQSLCIIGSRV